jgi:5-methylcytosine-specific restriction endonuclease McrA
MPCNYSNYPKDWKAIRAGILERAGDCCEKCGVSNKQVGYRGLDGKFYPWTLIEDCLENNGHDLFDDVLAHCFDKRGNPTEPLKIVLTVAHLDHDTANNDWANLKALCQRCHLLQDLTLHRTNAKETNRKKKGLQNLF